jgi:hypothetical protein
MSSTANLTTMITIDSADRNQIAYPNPAQYVYKLPQSVRNADTVELMMFQMVIGESSINNANNKFTLTDVTGENSWPVTIPEGTYTYGVTGNNANDLCTALASALNSAALHVSALNTTSFTVSSNISLDNSSIESSYAFYTNAVRPLTISNNSSNFNLLINSSTARVLGLSADKDINGEELTGYERGAGMCSSYNHNIIGKKAPDLNGEPYIVLRINDYHPNISLSTTMYTGFITIPLENKTMGNRFTISNDLKEKKGVYKLGPTESKIDQFTISILRPDGSLYDFNGYDHQIVLRVMRKDGQNFPT